MKKTWLIMLAMVIGMTAISFLTVNAAQAGWDGKVSGIVVDEKEEPLIGVSVLVKGTSNGTATDLDGKFTLTGVPEGAIIEFRCLGYYKMKQKAAKNMKVVMKENPDSVE